MSECILASKTLAIGCWLSAIVPTVVIVIKNPNIHLLTYTSKWITAQIMLYVLIFPVVACFLLMMIVGNRARCILNFLFFAISLSYLLIIARFPVVYATLIDPESFLKSGWERFYLFWSRFSRCLVSFRFTCKKKIRA